MSRKADSLAGHAAALEAELAWLTERINHRLHSYFRQASASAQEWPAAPDLDGANGAYADAVRRLELDDAGRMALILALAPHLRPQLLDPFFLRNANMARGFSEFGGRTGKTHSGFLPTVETLLFLLAGQDLQARLRLQGASGPVHRLVSADVLERHAGDEGEPRTTAPLTVTQAFLDLMLDTGQPG